MSEMELLANYSDEDSARSTPTLDRQHNAPPVTTPDPPAAGLQAEWESFEKMICGSAPPFISAPLPVAAPEPPSLQGKPNLSILSEPPTLTDYHDQPLFVDSNVSTGPPTLTNVGDLSKIDSSCEQSNGPSIHLTALSTEYNPEIVDDESSDDDEMPILTKVTESSHSSPEHSSDRSSSSGSRSSSVDSVKSFEKEKDKSSSSPPVSTSKKSSSPSKEVSSSHRKDARRHRRSRSRSPHRKHRRSSDRKRSRSRTRKSSDRKHRSRSHGKSGHHSSSHSRRHRRRSGSRSRRRPSRERRSSRDRHRRKERGSHKPDHSHDRHHRSRSHSRDRRRSRSNSRDRSNRSGLQATRVVGPKKKILTFKEKMRQQLMKASKMLSEQTEGSDNKPIELPNDRTSNVPMSAANVFQAISMAGNVTPQMALLQTMAAMHQKAQEMTGVAVPKYYNPAAVNPLKYAEQVQKRKLLWSKNKETKEPQEEVPGGHNQWQSTAFVQDQDGKMAAKFRKLMGMKEGEEEEGEEEDEEKARESEEKKKQTEELFYRLDKEYEFARMTTHTHRGIGLGFQSQGFPNT